MRISGNWASIFPDSKWEVKIKKIRILRVETRRSLIRDHIFTSNMIGITRKSIIFNPYCLARWKKRKMKSAVIGLVSILQRKRGPRYTIKGRKPNRNIDYTVAVERINRLKLNPLFFQRSYRLSISTFEKVLDIIRSDLEPKGKGGKNHVPPVVQLCLGLRLLAGASFLDLSHSYEVPPSHIHHYAWKAIFAINDSKHPFLNNIISPIHMSTSELEKVEEGFARLSGYRLRGTIAAGDGIVFRMEAPKNKEVTRDVISYFVRKGYYAYGLQAFCDSNCKFLCVASKICSSSGDNTAYLVTQLSKDIKAGLLPKEYHVVFDEAYVCTDQEMSPYPGRNLNAHKDAFNYYLSLNRQVIERAFGILVQRWGIL